MSCFFFLCWSIAVMCSALAEWQSIVWHCDMCVKKCVDFGCLHIVYADHDADNAHTTTARLAQSDRASDSYRRVSEGCEFDPRGGLVHFFRLAGRGRLICSVFFSSVSDDGGRCRESGYLAGVEFAMSRPGRTRSAPGRVF